MPTILSEAAGILMEILENPPREIMDEAVATQFAIEAASFYKQQLGSTGHLLSGTYYAIDPPSQEFLLNLDGFTQALYVQRRIRDTADYWEQVSVVNIDELDDEAYKGKLAATFFGNPATVRLSWDPATLTPSSLRIWYDPNSTEPSTLDQDLDLPLNILKYMIARRGVLLALPRLQMKAPMTWTPEIVKIYAASNAAQLAQYDDEFNLWRFNREDEGWSQTEGFDEQYGAPRRARRFF